MDTQTDTTERRPAIPAVPAIRVEGLTKRYGDRTAVDGLTFDVGWGRITGFLGPNGAGKSTTLRMVLGLVHPTAGRARILGHAYAELERPAEKVGALLEAATFHPRRTARQHLGILAAAADLPTDRVDRVLALTDLIEDADRRVGAYSLGMRQRLGLASALLGAPKVLILDEPANGLDPAGIRWLRRSLRSYASKGHAVLVSSHMLSEVSQVADDLVVIDRGRLVTTGGVDEIVGADHDLERAFLRLLRRKEQS